MRHRTADTPKGHRNYVIIACDVLLFLAMLKWLPVEPEVARGLAVLTFIKKRSGSNREKTAGI